MKNNMEQEGVFYLLTPFPTVISSKMLCKNSKQTRGGGGRLFQGRPLRNTQLSGSGFSNM